MAAEVAVAFRPVLTQLAVLAVLTALCAYSLARRPRRSERLLTVPPRPWVWATAWVIAVLLAVSAGVWTWAGFSREEVDLSSALAAAALELGAGTVLGLLCASATLVADRDGLYWFFFHRRWSEVTSVSRTETGVRFGIGGRPTLLEATVLDEALWAVDGHVYRRLRSLEQLRRRSVHRRRDARSPGRSPDAERRERIGVEEERKGGPNRGGVPGGDRVPPSASPRLGQ